MDTLGRGRAAVCTVEVRIVGCPKGLLCLCIPGAHCGRLRSVFWVSAGPRRRGSVQLKFTHMVGRRAQNGGQEGSLRPGMCVYVKGGYAALGSPAGSWLGWHMWWGAGALQRGENNRQGWGAPRVVIYPCLLWEMVMRICFWGAQRGGPQLWLWGEGCET